MRALPHNALRCPDDKTTLLWESFAGMRVYQEIAGRKVYNARCPTCNHSFSQTRRFKGSQK